MWTLGSKYREATFGSASKFPVHRFGVYSKQIKSIPLTKTIPKDLLIFPDTIAKILYKVDNMKINDDVLLEDDNEVLFILCFPTIIVN